MAFAIDKRRIAKNTLMLYVRMAVTMLIGFFTSRVTLQQLGVDDFGLNNLLSSVVAMLSFLNGSMGTAVQRFFSIEIGKGSESALKKVFSVGLYLHIIVALITVVIAEVFAVFFLDRLAIPPDRLHAAHVVFQIAVASLALNVVLVPYSALLRAREQFSSTATVEIVQAFLRLGVLYLLVTIPGDKLVVLSLLNFGVTLYYVTSITLLARRYKESHTLPSRDKALIRQMLTFISMLVVTVLAQLANLQGLQLLINIFFSLALNAAYAVAMQVYTFVNTFVTNFKQSVVPQMVAAYGAGDRDGMFRLLDTGTKITSILLLLISFPLAFESEYILHIWLKTPPEHASTLVALMVVNINVYSFSYFYNQAVQATGKIVLQQSIISLTYILALVAAFFTFKAGYGVASAIYVSIIFSAIQVANNLFFCHRQLGYDILRFLRRILIPVIAAVAIVSAILWAMVHDLDPGLWRALSVILVSTLLTFALGFFLILDRGERDYLRHWKTKKG